MNTPPNMLQISGLHSTVYESLYNQLDGSNSNHVEAPKAAAFLKTSGLPDRVLSQIWDLSDIEGKGYLDKRGVFVALKLIALVQSGKSPNLIDIQMSLPPPKLALEKFHDKVDWTIQPTEKTKYEEIFNSMSMMSDRIPGTKVKPLMMQSKLRVDVLTRIWDLSDIDQDGSLTKEEFLIAMHLMAKAKENHNIPTSLPPELLQVSKSLDDQWSAFDNLTSPSSDMRNIGGNRSFPTSWVVNAVDKAKFDDMFVCLDADIDGFVTGDDVKATFLQTGLPQAALAQIWTLCDLKMNGKLNSEQFALAMYLVNEKKGGGELPSSLMPEMIPPTMRPKPSTGSDSLLGSPQTNGSPKAQSAYPQNKELDDLSKELKELQAEKDILEQEVGEQEKVIRIRQSDVQNFQNEIETLHQMIKQLEMQKMEARKRLVEMGVQVENLRKQVDEKKELIERQEAELSAKRTELEKVKEDESQLQGKVSGFKQEIEKLTRELTNSQLQISQYKAKVLTFEEFEKQLREASEELESAMASNDVYRLGSLLARPITAPDFFEESHGGPGNGFGNVHQLDEHEAGFPSLTNAFMTDPFAGENLFPEEDPFHQKMPGEAFDADPFGNSGGFDSTQHMAKDPFADDPFAGRSQQASSPTPELPPKKGKAPPPRPAPPKYSAPGSGTGKPPPRPPAPEDATPDVEPLADGGDPWTGGAATGDPFAAAAGAGGGASSAGAAAGFDAFGSNFADFANFDKA